MESIHDWAGAGSWAIGAGLCSMVRSNPSKRQITMRRTIEIIIALGVILATMIFLSSCNHDIHWATTKSTPSGRHEYLNDGWASMDCNKLNPKQPIKPKNYRRLKNTFVTPGRR